MSSKSKKKAPQAARKSIGTASVRNMVGNPFIIELFEGDTNNVLLERLSENTGVPMKQLRVSKLLPLGTKIAEGDMNMNGSLYRHIAPYEPAQATEHFMSVRLI